MGQLNVKKDLQMKDYIEGDQRIFLVGHSANALSGHEVKEIYDALGDDFDTYFEAGNESTANYLATLS